MTGISDFFNLWNVYFTECNLIHYECHDHESEGSKNDFVGSFCLLQFYGDGRKDTV